jgi:hypothetical protein
MEEAAGISGIWLSNAVLQARKKLETFRGDQDSDRDVSILT